MTNSYDDELLEQNSYENNCEVEQNNFYAHEATFAPVAKQNVWSQPSFSRLFGSMLWGITLLGFVAGTIWWFDILPTSEQKKAAVVVAESSSERIQITPGETTKEKDISDPFEESLKKENGTIFSTNKKQANSSQGQTVAQAALKFDTPQKRAYRKRELPAPKELLTSRATTEQQWNEKKTFPPRSAQKIKRSHFVESASPSQIVLANGQKSVEVINPPQHLSMPKEKRPIPFPLEKNKLDLSSIDSLLRAGKELEAHRELSKLYWKSPEARSQIMGRLKATAKSIFISRQKHFATPYVVEQRETLAQIAQNHNVPWQYLARLNRTSPRAIRPGQKLKVIKGPFAAVINLNQYELTIHAHGYFVKRYQIGIDKENRTPPGDFKVVEKLENPTYYGANSVVMKADNPNSPLGKRWIDLGNSYGIHGTARLNLADKAKLKGCIRMRNRDIEEVFDFLGIGSVVKIQ
ncbi:hypothetical protein MNBD_PLANCTO02-453 [hydrothermal vent metagenome]|uniref:Uncharacterized protein n=1 Tax=hydrothermal vent metagenome TaxID=652676 RepID=A0A3B1DPJ0_9ZZZZ